jgi:hypothetical protein
VVFVSRAVVPVLFLLSLLTAAPLAQASDRSLERAIAPYKSRLTSDIGYLSNFAAPSRHSAPGVQTRVARILGDLAAVTSAAKGQRASSSSVRHGQSLVLSALHYATLAAEDARASAGAARSGNGAGARGDARAELSQINRAIPLFESGGHLLHLF